MQRRGRPGFTPARLLLVRRLFWRNRRLPKLHIESPVTPQPPYPMIGSEAPMVQRPSE
jgi:hypothetical protein